MDNDVNNVLIACRALSKDYESGAGVVHALREIDLEIRQGEFVAIVGTSGSGKSTLMNILGCLDRPTHGSYELAGFDIGARSSDARAVLRNRLIGFIFQGFNLLPRTSALENVELPLVYRGISSKVRRARALEALEAVGLGERVHHTPNQLSGGQQQRVAIARALVTSPPMLLADEPTGNLDTRTSLEVLALLQRLNQQRKITIILVTHEHDIAACASRVITFRDGRILSDVRGEYVDASRELAKLPPAEPSRSRADEEAANPAAAARLRLGGPVPRGLFVAMAAGGLLGLGLGAAYANLILGVPSVATPLALFVAFLLETAFALGFARKRFAAPITVDQRVRISLGYTLGSALVLGTMTGFGWTPWSKALLSRIEGLSGPSLSWALLGAILFLSTVALARYLTLALFGPVVASLVAPKKAA